MRVFIERWYSRLGSEDVSVDIHYDELRGRFEASAGAILLFESTELTDVLRWCMTSQSSTPAITLVSSDLELGAVGRVVDGGVDVSTTFEDPIIER